MVRFKLMIEMKCVNKNIINLILSNLITLVERFIWVYIILKMPSNFSLINILKCLKIVLN